MPKYIVTLKDIRSSHIVELDEDYPWGDDGTGNDHGVVWIWTEGNYECDCNRSLFMGIDELPCNANDNIIELVSIFSVNGNKFLDISG